MESLDRWACRASSYYHLFVDRRCGIKKILEMDVLWDEEVYVYTLVEKEEAQRIGRVHILGSLASSCYIRWVLGWRARTKGYAWEVAWGFVPGWIS